MNVALACFRFYGILHLLAQIEQSFCSIQCCLCISKRERLIKFVICDITTALLLIKHGSQTPQSGLVIWLSRNSLGEIISQALMRPTNEFGT